MFEVPTACNVCMSSFEVLNRTRNEWEEINLSGHIEQRSKAKCSMCPRRLSPSARAVNSLDIVPYSTVRATDDEFPWPSKLRKVVLTY